MNKAADIYLKENDKMAGFVRRFSDYCGISEDYGSRLNRIRKTFPPYTAVPVTRVNERILGNDAPGEITQQILTTYWDFHTRPDFNTEIIYK